MLYFYKKEKKAHYHLIEKKEMKFLPLSLQLIIKYRNLYQIFSLRFPTGYLLAYVQKPPWLCKFFVPVPFLPHISSSWLYPTIQMKAASKSELPCQVKQVSFSKSIIWNARHEILDSLSLFLGMHDLSRYSLEIPI